MSVHTWCCGFGEQFLRDTADLIDDDGLTARVLPLVDGYARAFAAEQLREAARGPRGCCWLCDQLHDRADRVERGEE